MVFLIHLHYLQMCVCFLPNHSIHPCYLLADSGPCWTQHQVCILTFRDFQAVLPPSQLFLSWPCPCATMGVLLWPRPADAHTLGFAHPASHSPPLPIRFPSTLPDCHTPTLFTDNGAPTAELVSTFTLSKDKIVVEILYMKSQLWPRCSGRK